MALRHDSARRVTQGEPDLHGCRRIGPVPHRRLGLHLGHVGGDDGRGDAHAPRPDVDGVRHQQRDVPVDARAGVPAGVGVPRMVHADGDHVLSIGEQIRRQVVLERGEAAGPPAQGLAVDPDLGITINAVEEQGDAPASGHVRGRERLPIPADAAGQEPGRTGPLGVERPLDAPVVRQGEGPPRAVIVGGRVRPRRVPAMEPPAAVEQSRLTHVSFPPSGVGLAGTVRRGGRESL